MFFPREKPVIPTFDQQDDNEKVELEIPSNAPQGGDILPHSSSKDHTEETNFDSHDIASSGEQQTSDNYSFTRDGPQRTIRKPAHYSTNSEHGLIAYALAVAQEIPEGIEPSTNSEANSYPNSSNWLMVMQEEIEIFHKKETGDLCDLLKGHSALTAKLDYKRKEGIPEVEAARWKARMIVQGYNQKEGIDFNEVFSLIVCHTSIRVLLAFIALFDLELEQLDMKTIFLYRELEEEI